MKVQYKFEVKSKTRTSDCFPLACRGVDFIVDTDDNHVLTHISILYKVDNLTLWPSITPDPEPGVVANITMHSPFIDRAQCTIRAAEGVLACFGVDQIIWNNPEEIWIPESEEERSQLNVFSASRSTKKATALDMRLTPFDIIARALLRAENVAQHEVPLAFFRKGKVDTYENRYIEACTDFLFMLETLFANGKFKTAQVRHEFTSSRSLLDAIASTIEDKELLAIAENRGISHRQKLHGKYMSKPTYQVAESFVELRGLLHHHTLKDKGRWHPDLHDAFMIDALFLEQVCFRVGFSLFSKEVFSQEAEQEYLACYKASRDGG